MKRGAIINNCFIVIEIIWQYETIKLSDTNFD